MKPRWRQTPPGLHPPHSVGVLSAGQYDLIARGGSADQARTMLTDLNLASPAA